MALLRSTATVGLYTLGSRVLGFVRDMLVAAFLGAGPVADAFVVAFRIPNLFRRLTAEGAFHAAFVPVFSGVLEREGRAAAERFAAQVLSVMVAALALFTLLAEAAMPTVIAAMAPGFVGDPARFDLTVLFTRLTFPYLLLITLVALLSAVLNSLLRFAAAAASPILLNAIMLAAIALFAHVWATPGHALSLAVTVGGIVQLALLLYACRRAGWSVRFGPLALSPPVKRWLRLMGPGAVGAGVMQLNIFLGTVIASVLPTGAVSYLYYADRVNQLPLGVIGVAIGTALLPLLSRRLRAGDETGGIETQNRAIELGLLLTFPATAALVAIPGPIITVLFERGAFGSAESLATARALAAFALGLPAYVLVRILSPGFFAREDTATPVKMGALAVGVNVGLSLALLEPLGHVGVALATSAASWVNAGVLAWALHRRGHFVADRRLRARLWRIAGASLVMVAALLPAAEVLAPMWGGTFRGALALAALIGLGLAVFGGAAVALGAARPAELRRALSREA